MHKLMLVAALGLGLPLFGCTHLDPTRVAADFGNSKRTMVTQQYFDPQAARNPSTVAPTGLDGAKAAKILEAYRDDNSDREFEDSGANINVLTSPAR